MSIETKLQNLTKSKRHILRKGSGLSSEEINALKVMGFIELHKHKLKNGKTPSRENCFTLTVKGKKYLDTVGDNTVSAVQVVKKVERTMEETRELFESLVKDLSKVGLTLDGIEHLLGMTVEIKSTKEPARNDDQKLLYLETAELVASPQMRLGSYTAIEMFYSVLGKIGMADEEITEYLTSLHSNGKLELSNAIMKSDLPHHMRYLTSEEGIAYLWGRLV